MPESTRSSTAAEHEPHLPHLWITVLAGGVGSRFWPVSTPARPKQLLPLAGDRPLIADTVERALRLVPPERLRLLAGEHLRQPFEHALPDLPGEAFLAEPRARGTAPVLAWAAWEVHRADPDAVLVSLHADHLIRPVEDFRKTVLDAARVAAAEDVLLSIGARPDRPETGYGYLQPGDAIDDPPGASGAGARRVHAFHEKPGAETAASYVEQGYLWNTGIFVWRAAVFLEEVRRHAPEVAPHLERLEAGDVRGFFDAVTSVSVDVAVMERSERVGVVPARFEWDDVGAWHALHRTRTPDAAGNVAVGDAVLHEARGNAVFVEQGTVVLDGVEDLVVVRSGDTVLVTHRDRTADLKRLVDVLPERLRERGT